MGSCADSLNNLLNVLSRLLQQAGSPRGDHCRTKGRGEETAHSLLQGKQQKETNEDHLLPRWCIRGSVCRGPALGNPPGVDAREISIDPIRSRLDGWNLTISI